MDTGDLEMHNCDESVIVQMHFHFPKEYILGTNVYTVSKDLP